MIKYLLIKFATIILFKHISKYMSNYLMDRLKHHIQNMKLKWGKLSLA